MSSQLKWFMVWQLILSIIIVVSTCSPLRDDSLTTYQQERIEALRTNNLILQKKNEVLDNQIDSLQWKVDSLEVQIATSEILTQSIREERNEKIHNVDSLAHIELYQFFAGYQPTNY